MGLHSDDYEFMPGLFSSEKAFFFVFARRQIMREPPAIAQYELGKQRERRFVQGNYNDAARAINFGVRIGLHA